ncbi:MAG: hypothetical protein IJV50_04505 [Lachnospiraceae bacterium]|nr:hypothetical protein [Lachnospiraceae bacterium]
MDRGIDRIIKDILRFVLNNIGLFTIVGIITFVFVIVVLVRNCVINKRQMELQREINKQREELLQEILGVLHLENIDSQLREFDDRVVVKSRQALNNYSDLKYFKEKDNFENVRLISESRKKFANQ